MKNIFSTGDAIDQRVGAHDVTPDHEAEVPPLEEVQKNTWAKMWPVLACGGMSSRPPGAYIYIASSTDSIKKRGSSVTAS